MLPYPALQQIHLFWKLLQWSHLLGFGRLGNTYSHRFDGCRFDCGSKEGFLEATVHYARKRGYSI